MNPINQLPEVYQGVFYIIAGTILLLWFLGILTYLLVIMLHKKK